MLEAWFPWFAGIEFVIGQQVIEPKGNCDRVRHVRGEIGKPIRVSCLLPTLSQTQDVSVVRPRLAAKVTENPTFHVGGAQIHWFGYRFFPPCLKEHVRLSVGAIGPKRIIWFQCVANLVRPYAVSHNPQLSIQ